MVLTLLQHKHTRHLDGYASGKLAKWQECVGVRSQDNILARECSAKISGICSVQLSGWFKSLHLSHDVINRCQKFPKECDVSLLCPHCFFDKHAIFAEHQRTHALQAHVRLPPTLKTNAYRFSVWPCTNLAPLFALNRLFGAEDYNMSWTQRSSYLFTRA